MKAAVRSMSRVASVKWASGTGLFHHDFAGLSGGREVFARTPSPTVRMQHRPWTGATLVAAVLAAAACGGSGGTTSTTTTSPTAPAATPTTTGSAVNTSAMYSQFGKAA